MSGRIFVVQNSSQIDRLCVFLKAQASKRPLSVAVDFWRKQRTTNANRRLWKLHQLAAESTGHTAEELHRDACGEFFGWEQTELFGRKETAPVRTTTTPDVLDTKQFADFMTFVEARYVEHLGVWLDG